jgi:hypothetical protein
LIAWRRDRENITFTKNPTQGTSKLKGGFAALPILARCDPELNSANDFVRRIMAHIMIANRMTPDGREKTLKAGFLSSMSPGLDFL